MLKNISKEWLQQKYIVENLSLNKISKLLNCTIPAVSYQLKKHNIPTRTISEANKIFYQTEEGSLRKQEIVECLKGGIPFNKGKSLEKLFGKEKVEELKTAQRIAKIGKSNGPHTEETKQKMREKALGRKNSEEAKRKMSQTRLNNPKYSGKNHPLYGASRDDIKGEKHPNWKGGITSLTKKSERVLNTRNGVLNVLNEIIGHAKYVIKTVAYCTLIISYPFLKYWK